MSQREESRREVQDRVDSRFREQHGIISRAQAISAGFTARKIQYRLEQGTWQRVFPNVYRLAAVPLSWRGEVLALVLSTGGVASHRCSAALWKLDVYDEPPPEVSIPHGKRSRHSHRLHRTTQWQSRDETTIDAIPCTGIERTILDCGAVASDQRVERIAEAAIRRRLTTWLKLAECLRLHSRQGRSGCGRLRRVLQRRLEDQTVPLSDFSRLIVNLLVENGIPRPEIEFRIVDDHGALILQTDLAWPEKKKAWELDGLAFHSGRTAMERDKRKRNRAKAHGWTIQEILWSMYIDDPTALVDMARQFLKGPT